MGTLEALLRILGRFLIDNQQTPAIEDKPDIKKLSTVCFQSLQSRWEILNAQKELVAQARSQLQQKIAEANLIKVVGKQAIMDDDLKGAEAAGRRYAELKQTIGRLSEQMRQRENEACETARLFALEAGKAREAAAQARNLADLETIINLQQKHQNLLNNQAEMIDEYENTKEELILRGLAQTELARLKSHFEGLTADNDSETEAITRKWRQEVLSDSTA